MMKLAELSITNICNFRCDYCKSEATYIADHRGKGWEYAGPIIDFDKWIGFVRSELTGYIIQVTGGEPLIVQGITGFLNSLTETNDVVLSTNGTGLGKLVKHISERVKFRVSYHPEYRKSNLIGELANIDLDRVLINYVVHPRHIRNGMVASYIDYLQKTGFRYEVSPFEGAFSGEYYRLFHEIYNGIKTEAEKMSEEFQIVVVQPTGRIFDCHGGMKEIGSLKHGLTGNSCHKRCHDPDGKSLCPMFDNIARLFPLHK